MTEARVGGERLFVAAIGHTDFIEHGFAKESGKWLATHIHHQQLFDGNATTRISEFCARHEIHANRGGAGRFLAVEDLNERWERRIDIIAGEAVDGEAPCVGH